MNKATLLTPCLLTGGTEVATLDIARALQGLGFDVEVLVYFDEIDQAMLSSFQSSGVLVRQLGLQRGTRFGSMCLPFALWRQMRVLRSDLIWVQYMTPTLVPLLVSRFFARRMVAAVHVAAGHYTKGGLLRLRLLARWWCDQVVCVSVTTARGIFGQTFDRVAVRCRVKHISNAIDTEAVDAARLRDWRSELNLSVDTFLIGFVGRLVHIKGVDILLRAAASVASVISNAHWVIVGDGSERGALEDLADSLGLQGRMHFVGSIARESIYSTIKGFDIAVVPSREEGFGLSALEAMACGVPLVATRVDALAEIVVEEQTGLLFTAEDDVDLAKQILRLYEGTELRDSLIKAGVERAFNMYSHTSYQRRIKALLADMGLSPERAS